jgi:hypothetical protein
MRPHPRTDTTMENFLNLRHQLRPRDAQKVNAEVARALNDDLPKE